jgi:hypothetical protein
MMMWMMMYHTTGAVWTDVPLHVSDGFDCTFQVAIFSGCSNKRSLPSPSPSPLIIIYDVTHYTIIHLLQVHHLVIS